MIVFPHTGALLKSNSFNTLSSKPKVKLVDEVIPPKQKGARDYNSLDMKEGPTRMMSKSMSFRSANSGRMNATESKVKMLSSKSTHVQDVKGLKQAKERGTFERKHLSKLDRPPVSSTTVTSSVLTPKLDQKLTSRGETSLPSYVSNNRDSKVVQSDGKLSLSKVTSSLGRKGVEIPVTSGVVLSSLRSDSANSIFVSFMLPVLLHFIFIFLVFGVIFFFFVDQVRLRYQLCVWVMQVGLHLLMEYLVLLLNKS